MPSTTMVYSSAILLSVCVLSIGVMGSPASLVPRAAADNTVLVASNVKCKLSSAWCDTTQI